jgi:hypothetical protein
MIWILSLAVWSISLMPLLYVFSKSKSPVWDRIDQRWREDDEPNYYYDFEARNIKRRLR